MKMWDVHMEQGCEQQAGLPGSRRTSGAAQEDHGRMMERIKNVRDSAWSAQRIDVDLTEEEEIMDQYDRIPKRSREERKQRAAWKEMHGSLKDFQLVLEQQMSGQDGGEGGGDFPPLFVHGRVTCHVHPEIEIKSDPGSRVLPSCIVRPAGAAL